MAENGNDGLEQLSLKKLVENQLLFSKVTNLLEQQKPYDYILTFLQTKGYKLAKGSLTNLKKKMQEAQDLGIPVKDIMDKREKKSIDDIPSNKIIGFTGKAKPVKKEAKEVKVEKVPVYSTEQVLETIINKGMHSIQSMDFVDPKTLLTAINLYNHSFGDKTRGLTTEALKQYQLINQATMSAYQEVFLRYVPKDKQEEALKEMDQRSQEILNQMGATKKGRELLKQLHMADLDIN